MNQNENIVPVYNFLSDEAALPLTERRPVSAVVDGKQYEGMAQAILKTQPRPAIVLDGELSGIPPASVMTSSLINPDLLSELLFDGKPIEGFSGGIWGNLDAVTNQFIWHPSTLPVIGRGNEATLMKRVDFHLFNFRDIKTPGTGSEMRNNGGRAIHKITMLSSNIKVRIVSLFETSDQIEKVRAQGGTRLTHVGRIERIDQSEFAGTDAQQYLHELKTFLSFSVGMLCLPVCACGFDDNGHRVWEAWSEPSQEFGSRNSWFHHGRCEQISRAFPCYMKTIERDIWAKTIHAAIYWYLKANDDSRGIDAGVILAQAAFERLAFTYLVSDKKVLTKAQFRTNKAAENFMTLFDELNIPTAIRPACVQLTRISAMRDFAKLWTNLPMAITSIRNCLVHPETKDEQHYFDAMFDTWSASLWCLELAILGVIGYDGEYWNRIEGRVEGVPWLS